MSTIKEKEIFSIEWAKIHLNEYLNANLKSRFSLLNIETYQNTCFVKIYLFSSRTYVNKKKISYEVQQILKKYSPSFYLKIEFLDALTPETTYLNPKYYFERIVTAYNLNKTNPFNYLSKVESFRLNPMVEGLRVTVKGKRGTRKFKKTAINGNVSYHSNIKGVLTEYKGTIETSLGTMGIKVFVKKA